MDKDSSLKLANKLSEDAKKIAQLWEGERGASKNKIRKFFSEFRRIERVYKNGGSTDESFYRILPQLKLIISKVYYDSQRSGNSLPMSIKSFFEKEIKSISVKEDFEEFMLYFEAILGFANLKN